MSRLLVATAVLALSLPAYAQAADAPDASTSASRTWLSQRSSDRPMAVTAPSTTPSTGRTAALLVVLAGLGGAAFWLKRKRGGSKAASTVTPAIRVVSSTRVGPKAHAVVANVAGRTVLLGVTDHSVQRLAWLDAPNEDEPVAEAGESEDLFDLPPRAEPSRAIARYEAPTPSAPAGRGFGELLRSALGKSAPEPASAALAIAESTQDHYSPSAQASSRAGRAGRSATEPMLSVESQAAGLVARLQELGR